MTLFYLQLDIYKTWEYKGVMERDSIGRMKWPLELILIRHGESEYNILKAKKAQDPEYQHFAKLYKERPVDDQELHNLALKIKEKYALKYGDYNTPLTEEGERQAYITGQKLAESGRPAPDVILYSPYLRTRQTLEGLMAGWRVLKNVKTYEDDRIREQDHGLSVLYSDWRVFNVMHSEQKELRDKQGPYWYRYPQGESVCDVRDRVRSIVSTLIREYHGQKVLMVTHHLTILSIRAILERLTPEEFIQLDHEDKPINCGVTIYKGKPNLGKSGHIILEKYNEKLY